jgi:hypothetical protein
MMQWRDYLNRISTQLELFNPVTKERILRVESVFGIQLPSEYRELLQETNGVFDQEAQLLFIYSLRRLRSENLSMRRQKALKVYMPMDNLVFFADAGNGDKFAFPISKKGEISSHVFAWNHENDSREWCAPSLQVFIEWWYSGKIKL